MLGLLTLFRVDTFHLQNPWFHVLIPLVLGPETLGFATWNQGFQSVIRWVSENAPLHPQKWIFMHFLGGRGVVKWIVKNEEWRIHVMSEANHSRTVVSVPRPPAPKKSI